MFMNMESNSKCIYMAPTKALCAEKTRAWSSKLEPLGIKCELWEAFGGDDGELTNMFLGSELTGDSVSYGKGAWHDAKDARLM